SGAAAGLQVLLLLEARLAEMDLRVDDARQDVQAGAVDRLAGGAGCNAAERSDTAVADADVTGAGAVVVDDRAALQHQVECLCHRSCLHPLASPPPAAYVVISDTGPPALSCRARANGNRVV